MTKATKNPVAKAKPVSNARVKELETEIKHLRATLKATLEVSVYVAQKQTVSVQALMAVSRMTDALYDGAGDQQSAVSSVGDFVNAILSSLNDYDEAYGEACDSDD